MPITPGMQTEPISYQDFHALDYEVMGSVFSIHRDLGRFWREQIYRDELAFRCQKAGFANVAIEVPINVSFEDFTKVYYIDLLINNAIYELKATPALGSEDERQAINYLMLTGLSHAKLVNMRPPSVQHRFVSTKLTPEKRHRFTIDDAYWHDLDDDSNWLKRTLKSLLDEWGLFLEVNLFYEAIEHFRGGEENVVKEIEVRDGSRIMGKQKIHMIDSDIAFKISAVTKGETHFENHLRRFLSYTSLRAIQWINFNPEMSG